MGQAGRGPVEVGKELADHARHVEHSGRSGRDRLASIIEASLLAVVRPQHDGGRPGFRATG